MRRHRFDREIADEFLSALRAALHDSDAAMHANVDVSVIERWRRAEPPFDAQVRRAKADQALLHAGRVRAAAREDWHASLVLVQLAAQEREITRLRELTTD